MADDVEDAGSLVRAGLSSVIRHIRGLQRVRLKIRNTDDEQHASIRASLAVGTNIGALSITRVGHGGGYTSVAMGAAHSA